MTELERVTAPGRKLSALTGHETMLLEARGRSHWALANGGLVAGVVLSMVLQSQGPAFVGFLAWMLIAVTHSRTQWFLTLDRVRKNLCFLAPVDIDVRKKRTVTRHGDVLTLDGVRLLGSPGNVDLAETYLRLLGTDWFVDCRLVLPLAALCPATRATEEGWLLALQIGVLFMPTACNSRIQDRVAAGPVQNVLPPRDFLLLISHVAPARFDALLDEFENLDADWLPARETAVTVDEASQTVVLTSGLVNLKAEFSMDSNGKANVDLLRRLLS